MSVILNEAAGRFELIENGRLAFADYELRDGVLYLLHVEAHPELRGQGSAGRLMQGMMALVETKGWRVVPVCGYAVSYLQRHSEFSHLLAEA